MPDQELYIQSPPAEVLFGEELTFLERWDLGPRPPGWRLTPRAVVTFVVGSRGETINLPKDAQKK